jgi:hypothetical protein
MDFKNTLLFSCVILLCCISIAASYYRFIVLNEYDMYYDDYGEQEEAEEETAVTDI